MQTLFVQNHTISFAHVLCAYVAKNPPCLLLHQSNHPPHQLSHVVTSLCHNLLDPDSNTITRIPDLSRVGRSTRILLSDYFLETANAFLFCTLLLKNIHRLCSKYESLKPKFQSENNDSLALVDQFTELSRWFAPFTSSGSRIQITRSGCLNLLKRLESSRDKTRAKLKLIKGLTHSSWILVLVLATTLIVTIASHAFTLFTAGPTLLTDRFKPVGLMNKLTNNAARLEVAAKGTYILSRDLDTISQLVTQINDEVEHCNIPAPGMGIFRLRIIYGGLENGFRGWRK
ncbi:unnamed protein product [Arabis nemorensis]|uniref:Uncharacterized protein n=1 Tax=Arabis nemorensis TaxID=586526 RepID=A0A565C7Q2_9BRAS|nr:unnamed protein product [Arabis nemorensis]